MIQLKSCCRLVIFLVLSILFITSCGKDEGDQDIELPGWLMVSIRADERQFHQHPGSMKAYGVWTRTTWREEYYYEYFNPLSSSMARPVSHDNDTLHVYVGLSDTPYNDEKCCEVVVWKGPKVNW